MTRITAVCVLLLAHAGLKAAAEKEKDTVSAAQQVTSDVVVYGATAAGCIAAIAASRGGAKNVVAATPHQHVGGMTTGGIMHADVGNESVIAGITLEYFLRVEAQYPPRPSAYGCLADRCILLDGGSGHPDSKCGGSCAPLAAHEWLAVNFLSVLSKGNRTLTVSLPKDQATSYIKKGEELAIHLPASMVQKVKQGQVFHLARPATVVDKTYYLIELSAHPLSVGSPVAPPLPGAPPGWLYESHVAERVLEEMLAEANVTVVRGLIGLASASKEGTVIRSVTTESGVTLTAHVWVDGSYEGDLARVAGADTTWGRESVAQYNESGAGRRPPSIHYNVDPFWPDGSVIPHVSGATPVPVGEADRRIEVYDFRLCMTNSPGNRIPLTKPAGYNTSEWEFWRRLYVAHPPNNLAAAGLGCLGPIPNNYSDCGPNGTAGTCVKCDMLGMQHGTDMLNGAWDYPNGTTSQRAAIREAHIQYTLGLLWFWATDPVTPYSLHQEMAQLGFCADEYRGTPTAPTDPAGFPYQLYVREASRLIGDFVWTEHDPPAAQLQRSIGLGAYTFDCHWVSLYVEHDSKSNKPYVAAEGRVNNGHDGKPVRRVGQAPYEIPYDVLLPKRLQLTNLLVPVAASMSHIRQNAVRMEPTWMIMAQGAGVAAAMAVENASAVQDVDVLQLQAILAAQNQKLWPS